MILAYLDAFLAGVWAGCACVVLSGSGIAAVFVGSAVAMGLCSIVTALSQKARGE